MTGLGEGEIMPFESIATPGSGHLKLTSSLGDVRSELGHPCSRLKCGFFR